MISYEELSAALERYRARTRGEAVPAHVSAEPPARAYSAPPPPAFDGAATGEVAMPDETAHHHALGGDEESTQVGSLPGGISGGAPPQAPLSDEHSNELDIHDVLSDEEIH